MSLLSRFEQHYIPVPESGCWLWTGTISGRGYGRLRTTSNPRDALEGAHRVSWKIFHGEIPDGMMVCHRCDVPCCVNPAHLFLGNGFDNMRDASKKGRMRWKSKNRPELLRGEDHPKSKLTWNEVAAIRDSDLPGIDLSKKYGVSNNSITKIRLYKTWRVSPSAS